VPSTQTVTEEQTVSEEVCKKQIATDGDGVVVAVQAGAG